jgi:hypothetical protein
MWWFRNRPCAECKLRLHDFCLRKRIARKCGCQYCWGHAVAGDRAQALVPVPRHLGQPLFIVLAYNDFHPETNPHGGPLVLSSQNVTRAGFSREYTGYTRGWGGAKLLNERITVVTESTDFTQLRGEFGKIMADMWHVLTGQRPSP